MTLSIVVLASVGCHPSSKRLRLALEDARALTLANGIGDASIEVLHAGPREAAETALRDALGMGAARLTVLEMDEGADPMPALIAALRQRAPDMIVAGRRTERGEGSGMVPFLIAEALGMPLVTAVTNLALNEGRALLDQAAAGGRRRRIGASMPLVVTVDEKAPAPRLAAFGPARRGKLALEPVISMPDERRQWNARPARPRPKRLSAPNAAAPAAGKQVLHGLDAEAAARAILTYLQQEDIVSATTSSERVS